MTSSPTGAPETPVLRPRAFYLCALVAVVLFGILNIAIRSAAKNTLPRQIARHIDNTQGLNCLALGNSLMEAGFNAPVFQTGCGENQAGVIAVNAGLGSSYPVEHLLLLRRAFQKRPEIRQVLYGFFDFQLIDPPRTHLRELIGNRAMLYYFEPDVAASYYRWPLWERLGFDTARLFPAIQERGALWAKVELFRRRLGGIGMPVQQTNQFGRVRDFALLEALTPAEFIRESDAAASRELSRPVQDIIRLSREHGARIMMIEMPMSASHIARFYSTQSWQRYRAHVKEMLAAQGATYISASEWIQDEHLFADPVHLNPKGSAIFSKKLAQQTCTRETLVSTAYDPTL